MLDLSGAIERVRGIGEEPPATRLFARVGVVRAHLAARAAIALVAAGFALALFLRLWQIDTIGYNSDEAVYAGQAAALANDAGLKPFFPVFRAHPLLFQTILSVPFHFGVSDLVGRLLAALFGLGTIVLAYKLGALLYGRRAGVIAALILGLMPYDVLVSRQVLLDGPMTFFATLTLYLLALFATTRRPAWLYAAGGMMGLTVLGKETSILVVGATYAFFALAPEVHARLRDLACAAVIMVLTIAPYPLALKLAGNGRTGEQYLAWQLFRRPNHEWTFYPATVPLAIGPLVVVAAAIGIWFVRRELTWRETLLLSWIAVPALFFQLWPVKGYQYLLPTAPAFAVLAARTLAWRVEGRPRLAWAASAAAAVVALSLAFATWQRVERPAAGQLLAGAGGVAGGRELGHWIAGNVPEGAVFLTVGPSMANLVQFYGRRKAYGVSVGTNPLRRNPAYDPIPNPDRAIRASELQYLVWDVYSAARSPFFANKLLRYARRYHGRVVHTESITVTKSDGRRAQRPLAVVYEVRP
ncbi:MAG TPA: glycosyltransferase family 39 protein [Gaiellaceae bacterium]